MDDDYIKELTEEEKRVFLSIFCKLIMADKSVEKEEVNFLKLIAARYDVDNSVIVEIIKAQNIDHIELAKKIHEQGREKMKPLMEEGKVLHEKMNKVRKENMAEFEKILTDEQKENFEKMKQNFREEFKNKRPHHRPHFKGPKGDKE